MMPDYNNVSQAYSTATVAAPETSVVAQIDEEIARLFNVIEMLDTRLHKVLAPQYASPASDTEPQPVSSEIRNTQRALSTAIDAAQKKRRPTALHHALSDAAQPHHHGGGFHPIRSIEHAAHSVAHVAREINDALPKPLGPHPDDPRNTGSGVPYRVPARPKPKKTAPHVAAGPMKGKRLP